MKIVAINALPYGSVAGTMLRISDFATKLGHEYYTFSKPIEGFNNSRKNHEFIGTCKSISRNNKLSVYTGFDGIYARRATRSLIKRLDEIKPDIIHLHNLHGWFINLPLLFKYIKKNNTRVLWKFSDCWPFTGQCPGFASVNCEKWKTGCYHCPQYKNYPQAKIDMTKWMYRLKKKWFTDVKRLKIVTPSNWLKGLVQQSFLKDYDIITINNGIDLSVFKPTPSDFRQKYGLEDKKIVLGVASDWSNRKGIDVLVNLSEQLGEDYQVVVVGVVKNEWDNGKILFLPPQKATELAAIYTASDVFANPTREETFGLVNVESIACGTPVVMFNTDGAPETIDETCGIVVEKNNETQMLNEVKRVCESKPFSADSCVKHAQNFEKDRRYMDYFAVYDELMNM